MSSYFERKPSKTVVSNDLTRSFTLNMPQLFLGGLSENWFLKEIGDMHWHLISSGYGTSSGELTDSSGDRLYASFVRIKWNCDTPLSAFNENSEFELTSQLSRYGNKMIFSDGKSISAHDIINFEMMSVFSSRSATDNTSLKKGEPSLFQKNTIPLRPNFPDFAKEFMDVKQALFGNEIATLSSFLETSIFSCTYHIEPVDDINGVGLLYFASYPKICDKCERLYFNTGEDSKDWAERTSTIARDIYYFGNANPNEKLSYVLASCNLSENGVYTLEAYLFRISDGEVIAKVITEKVKIFDGETTEVGNSLELELDKQYEIDQAFLSKINREELSEKVLSFLSTYTGVSNLTVESDFRGLGIESIAYTELAEMIASDFQISCNPSKFYGLFSVNELVGYLLDGSIFDRSTSSKNESYNASFSAISGDEVAIIAHSFRIPGATDDESFWELLKNGKSEIGSLPSDRLELKTKLDRIQPGLEKGGYLTDIASFDASFFKISPRESMLMDPQQRILLEESWRLIEHAGYQASDLKGGKTGVYIAASGSDYDQLLKEERNLEISSGTGTANAILANRISYHFDFHGPSIHLDTACSSSLVAIHEAVKSIQSGDCDQAIVGAINLICHPSRTVAYHSAGMLSKDGLCYTFDDRANGYVRGEGCILFLLKPLKEALRDQDSIEAIIRGSAVNHTGFSGGLTVPNPVQQQALIEDAIRRSAIDVHTISYVEAHGTGTPLGDPIEISGLTEAFQCLSSGSDKPWATIGSVKTNIGHLEAASGMAGMLKVILSMRNEQLPPTVNFDQLNPKIELKNSPFTVQHTLSDWKAVDARSPLRAGVSSFGIGGTNGHVILEKFSRQSKEMSGQYEFHTTHFVLSAKTESSLRRYVLNSEKFLQENPEVAPLSLAYSLQTGRDEMDCRLVIVFDTIPDLVQSISDYLNNTTRNEKIYTSAHQIEEFEGDSACSKIAKQWCSLQKVDWKSFWKQTPTRIQLPTYPFDRKRYWIPSSEQAVEATISHEPVSIELNAPFEHSHISKSNTEMDTSVKEKVILELADVLYLSSEEIQSDKSFIDLGLDSILGVEFIKKINQCFELELSATKIYEYPTVHDFADYITKLCSTTLSEGSSESPLVSNKIHLKELNDTIEVSSSNHSFQPIQLKHVDLVENINSTPDNLQDISARVRSELCAVLYLDAAELNETLSFVELGLDSILGVEFIKKINTRFNLDLRVSALYDYSTLADFTHHLNTLFSSPIPAKDEQQPIIEQKIVLTSNPATDPLKSETIDKAIVTEMLASVLYLEVSEIQPDKSFVDLGLDSILGVEFIKKINERFSLNLNASIIYDYSTLTDFTNHLLTLFVNVEPKDLLIEPISACVILSSEKLENGEYIFQFSMDALDAPFLNDHLVFGEKVLPTDAYIELLVVALKKQFEYSTFSIENILIHKSYKGTSNSSSLSLRLKPVDDRFRFIFSSEEQGKEVIHVRGFVLEKAIHQESIIQLSPNGSTHTYSCETLKSSVKGALMIGGYEGIRRSLSYAEQFGEGVLRIDTKENKQNSYLAQILDGALLYCIQYGQVFHGQREGTMWLPYRFERMLIKELSKQNVNYTCRIQCLEQQVDSLLFNLEVKDEKDGVQFTIEGLELRPVTDDASKTPDIRTEDIPATDVAIIGISCRFPEANSYQQFWENLKQGIDSVHTIDEEKWGGNKWFHPERENKNTSCSNQAAFINESDRFDPLFFGISPSEAELMDPQQRIFLEESWKAFEDAAYNPSELARQKIGVFIGAGAGDYLQVMKENDTEKIGAVFTGTSSAILSGRISYYFNFTGPSFTLDTGCSSSLVAVDRAYQSVLAGESHMALAGGISLMTSPQLQIWTSQVGMSSKDGRCKPFDNEANGIVSGEGVGVVLLKKLADAVRDGDHIHAVIKGSSINQDGKTNGITAPSMRSQKELQLDVYKKFAINPETISYVEAHGTGTKLGDPIEVEALTESFGAFTKEKQFCAIGSVKANIGHTSYSAGIGGLIKIVMMMKNEQLVPSLHCDKVNDQIRFEQSPFYLNRELKKWESGSSEKRRAALNNFGFSGTNAHLVLEEYKPVPNVLSTKVSGLFVLSAKNSIALKKMCQQMIHFLETTTESIADITYTLQIGREAMKERLAFISDDKSTAIHNLKEFLAGSESHVQRGTATDSKQLDIRLVESITELTIQNEVLKQWVTGTVVNWHPLYKDEKPNKVHLPSYPFERERYWFDSFSKQPAKPQPKQHPISIKERYSWAESSFTISDQVTVEWVDTSIALVKMNFLETRNMFTRDFVQSVQQTFVNLRKNKELKVVVLTGYGDVFSMGGSQEELAEIANGSNKFTAFPFLFRGLLEFEIPVISAIQGHAFGGGLVFGLYGDIVLLSENATYSANFMKYGFTPGMGATFILGEKLGKTLATEMMFTARMVSGAELKQRGAGVIITNNVMDEALRIAKELAQKPRLALETLKIKVSSELLNELDHHVQLEEEMHDKTFTADVLKKINDQFNKRTESTPIAVSNQVQAPQAKVNSINSKAIEQELLAIFEETLHISAERLLAATSFVDIGLDSISGVLVIRKINEQFSIQLETIILYEYYTFEKLLDFIQQSCSKESYSLIDVKEEPRISIPTVETDSFVLESTTKVFDEKVTLRPLSEFKTSIIETSHSQLVTIQEQLIEIFVDVLHITEDRLNQGLSFVDLGLDSINGVEIVRMINSAFSIQLETIVLYDHHTLQKLTALISSSLPFEHLTEERINPKDFELYTIQVQLKDTDAHVNSEQKKQVFLSNRTNDRPIPVREEKAPVEEQEARQQTKETINSTESNSNNAWDIAVVGVSGRFPKAENVETFWNNVKSGKDCISEIPESRWSTANYYASQKDTQGKTYSKWMGCIDDVANFDALFFNISPLEAEKMDPQQRLLLEESWKAIEDSAYSTAELAEGKCGVYFGVSQGDYMYHLSDEQMDANFMIGRETSVMAGRVSYYLDLKGPAVSIDSACSSSLTSIHLACQAIRNGDCDSALAGGVYLRTNEQVHIMSSDGGMLSEDGKCYTFDNRANGFVPGEGVGVVVLKSLEQAKKEGAHIYAVIKGSAINQDGKTNGITAPSYSSQTRLQKEVYDRFGIDPETISYIEAHGTGTKLGDPIEIKALKQSFSEYTKKENYCAIGSVKTNIGHTIIAAGVAGFLKVVYALKNQQLPPSIHFEKLNEHIDLDGTPFYINTELKPWITTNNQPRRAAINSFGISGTNAHMVVEEYLSDSNNTSVIASTHIVPFSAKNQDRLVEKIRQFNNWLKENKNTPIQDIASTLQMGRQAMEERTAFVVNSTEELLVALDGFAYNQKTAFSANDNEPFISLEEALSNKDWNALAKAWINGHDVEWKRLHEVSTLHKISLPTYPFSPDPHWISVKRTASKSEVKHRLHPLVDCNNSTLSSCSFQSTFDGNEAYFSEHIFNGKSILPGTAQLEIMRYTASTALNMKDVQLKNINWLNPFYAKDAALRTTIQPHQDGCKISCYGPNNELISEGECVSQTLENPAQIDLKDLQHQIDQSIVVRDFYHFLDKKGFHYGDMFQNIEQIWGDNRQVLAKLKQVRSEQMTWCPYLLDTTLHSSIGTEIVQSSSANLQFIPVSAASVKCFAPFESLKWVHAQKVNETKDVLTYTIVGYDDAGHSVLKIDQFSVQKISQNTQKELGLTYFKNDWKERSLVISKKPMPDEKRILLLGGSPLLADYLKQELEVEVETITVDTDQECLMQVFSTIKKWSDHYEKQHVLVVYTEQNKLVAAGISGLLKVLQQEKLGWEIKTIGLGSLVATNSQEIKAIIENELQDTAPEVRIINRVREVRELQQIKFSETTSFSGFQSGVTIITGGNGALGLLTAHYIHAKGGIPILIGRQKMDDQLAQKMGSINRKNYFSCDVTDLDQLKKTLLEIEQQFGQLKGVIHAAGTKNDQLIRNKSVDEFEAVLSSKVRGIVLLDELTKEKNLEFIISFSSVAGVFGNIGQSDYACANAYLDEFARMRNERVLLGERKGRSLSVNWPLWHSEGMNPDDETLKYLQNDFGMTPLTSTEAFSALEKMLVNEHAQLLVWNGKSLLQSNFEDQLVTVSSNELNDRDEEQCFQLVRSIIARELKISEDEMKGHIPFEKFGINSILITKLTNSLSEFFEKLPRTLFFEYQNLNQLSDYIFQRHYHKRTKETILVDSQNSLNNGVFDVNDTKIESNDIAIIGMSGRFPQADNLNQFWENLKAGKDCITEIPQERWDSEAFYDEKKGVEGKSYSKWGGFVNGVDEFDPLFFNISPKEAELMDPQERIFLQTAWEAMEDAGYTRELLREKSSAEGNVGVFAGVMFDDYPLLGIEERLKGNNTQPGFSTGSIANRVSYFMDFNGPSITLNTMCSSSLTAIHLACESLLNESCEFAFAGGVNLCLHPNKYLTLSQGRFVSSQGKCESFGKGAEGYVPAEGVGVILLKRLNKAIADGDNIHAVIKGTAINHGGKTNGYSVPNPFSQALVVEKALKKAAINSEQIGYIEAHGTGTSLGDPIEIAGLSKVFGEANEIKIGSVKSNMGHAESAAGISALLKVVLQLKHQILVPSLHAEELNPEIDFENSSFTVQRSLENWTVKTSQKRIAGISSFGAGGSNAHFIVEEFCSDQHKLEPSKAELILLSAKTKSGLARLALKYKDYCSLNNHIDIRNLAYTAQIGREHFEERLAFVVNDMHDFKTQLEVFIENDRAAFYGSSDPSFVKKRVIELQPENAKEQLQSIASEWILGENYEWDTWYSNGKVSRLSLPTYPFEKERYWVNKDSVALPKLHSLLHTKSEKIEL